MNDKMNDNMLVVVGNLCLKKAQELLEQENDRFDIQPTVATVEVIEKLVAIAVSIDRLNLQWAIQSLSPNSAYAFTKLRLGWIEPQSSKGE